MQLSSQNALTAQHQGLDSSEFSGHSHSSYGGRPPAPYLAPPPPAGPPPPSSGPAVPKASSSASLAPTSPPLLIAPSLTFERPPQVAFPPEIAPTLGPGFKVAVPAPTLSLPRGFYSDTPAGARVSGLPVTALSGRDAKGAPLKSASRPEAGLQAPQVL